MNEISPHNKLKSLPNINDIRVITNTDNIITSITLRFENIIIYKFRLEYSNNGKILLKFEFTDNPNRVFCTTITSINKEIFENLLNRYYNNDKNIDLFILKCYKLHRNNIDNPMSIYYDFKTCEFKYNKVLTVIKIYKI